MNTVNTYIKWTFAICCALVMAACSEIAEKGRLEYVAPSKASRNVLVEDFTGQMCVNCPAAQRILHEVQDVYGDTSVIVVAIHCGPYGFAGNASVVGLKNEIGETYWNAKIDPSLGQPTAMINRGAATNSYNNWSVDIDNALKQSTDVKLSIDVDYDEATRNVTINTSTMAQAGKDAKLQLWLTEDSIVAVQKDGGQTVRDYVHNHVLRAAINGDWGESISYGEAAIRKSTTYTIPAEYVAKNCNIVAFVYGDNGVEQATASKVKSEK